MIEIHQKHRCRTVLCIFILDIQIIVQYHWPHIFAGISVVHQPRIQPKVTRPQYVRNAASFITAPSTIRLTVTAVIETLARTAGIITESYSDKSSLNRISSRFSYENIVNDIPISVTNIVFITDWIIRPHIQWNVGIQIDGLCHTAI